MAGRLLRKHLDAPGRWLAENHLHHYIVHGESVQDSVEHNRRRRNPSTTAVQQAVHGLGYTVYGKPDVRRLMFEVFNFEQIQPNAV